jgi:hypothetical protein
MPDFEFVNLNRPGDEKRHSTKIRRHVMKDIGKARRKPKKPDNRSTARGGYFIRSDFESQDQHTQAAMSSQTEAGGMGERSLSMLRRGNMFSRKKLHQPVVETDTMAY